MSTFEPRSGVDWLADHERRLQRLERPTAGRVRIGVDVNGRAALRVYDAAGVLRCQLGEQTDGVYTLRIWNASSVLLFDALVP